MHLLVAITTLSQNLIMLNKSTESRKLINSGYNMSIESFHMKSAKIWQFPHSKFLIFLNFFPDVLHTLLWKYAKYGIRIAKTHRVTLIYSWLGLSVTSQLVNFKQFQKQISQELDKIETSLFYSEFCVLSIYLICWAWWVSYAVLYCVKKATLFFGKLFLLKFGGH